MISPAVKYLFLVDAVKCMLLKRQRSGVWIVRKALLRAALRRQIKLHKPFIYEVSKGRKRKSEASQAARQSEAIARPIFACA